MCEVCVRQLRVVTRAEGFMRSLVAGAAGLVLASAANAAFYVENEGNNSRAIANFIGAYTSPGDGIVVDGTIDSLLARDEDYFRFSLDAPAQIVLSIFGRPNSSLGDSFVELIDVNGVVLASDDNGGIGLFSSLEYNTTAAGDFFIRVTTPVGSNAPNFNYKMIVGLNIVPTPGASALLGLGGLAMVRRRR